MTTTAFNQDQFQNPYPEDIQYHYWSLARHRIIYRHLYPLLNDREDLILDVGCGRGMAVQWLRGRGLDAIGCDLGTPQPIGAEVAPFLHLGIAAEALPEELSGRVRIILLLDVLEHISEPVGFLNELLRKFRNCRHVLLTLPARKELWSNYDEYYGHMVRYDLLGVQKLADDSANDLREAGYCFHSLWLAARLMIALRKKRQIKIRPPSRGTRWLHQLIARGFVVEERILSKSWVGTSILGVLKTSQSARGGEHHSV